MSAEFTIEQKRALALAAARARMAESDVTEQNVTEQDETPQKRGFGAELSRQLGLTGRAAIEGVLGLPDVLASPIRVAGNAIKPGLFPKTGGQTVADMVGLPRPENGTERFANIVGGGIAGAGGTAKAADVLATKVAPAAQSAMQWLAANPKIQMQSAIGAGAGQHVARENNVGPYGEIAAALAGGIAAPASLRGLRLAAEPVMDIGATIGASFGNKRGINRLSTDAIERGLGESIGPTRSAMYGVDELVPGAKPTVAEAIAQANTKTPEQFGGWAVRLQKDLSGARGVEDVLPSVAKQQKAAIRAENMAIRAELWPKGEAALKAANASGGVPAASLDSAIEAMAQVPANTGSSMISKALAGTRAKLASLTRADGTIDAEALYSLRKELGNDIKGFAKETNNWDKKVAGGLERDIQRMIDDSIESAGGAGWKDQYLAPYSARKQKITEHLARQKAAQTIASGVKPTKGSNIAPGEAPHPPNLLNYKMNIANWALRHLSRDANDPVVKDLTRRLSDPKAFAELLNRPPTDPLRIRAMEVIKRGQIAAAIAASQENGDQQ